MLHDQGADALAEALRLVEIGRGRGFSSIVGRDWPGSTSVYFGRSGRSSMRAESSTSGTAALAAAINSLTFLTPSSGVTARTVGVEVKSVTGVKSFTGS